METKKKVENACACDGKTAIKAYCQKCKVYICPDCHVSYHVDHDEQVVDLAEKSTRYLADYQKLFRTASLMADRRQVHIKEESIDSIINVIKGQLVKAKETLQGDINKTTENSLKGVERSPLVQEFVQRRAELVGKAGDPLGKIREELAAICKELLRDIAENKFESVDKRVSDEKLKSYEEEIKKLSKDSVKDLEFINELRKLKQTTVEYSYDPMAVMGMIKVQSAVRKPARIIQFDREKNALAIYNIETGKTYKTAINSGFIMPFRFVAAEVANKVYLNGGDNDHGHYLKSLYLYDELRGGLIPMANMQVARSRHAMVGVEEHSLLYAIGGETATGVTRSSEIYDIKENAWKVGPELNEARCGMASCIAGKGIYAIGGWNESYLGSIEMLEIGKDKWETVKLSKKHNALKPVQSPGAVAISENEILIFGGYKEGEELSKDTYIFNIKAGTVEKGKDMAEAEAFISSEVKKIGDKCYAYGYVNGGLHTYDIEKREWTYVPSATAPK